MAAQGLDYRPDIDGLRAIAVTSVVAYHVGLHLVPGGFVGVDVFFVISGYLITRLLMGELEQTGQIDLLQFYARRIRRLLPAALVVVAIVLLATWLLLTPVGGEQQRVARSAVAALTFWSNIYFLRTTGGYFDPASDLLPLLHTWSLSVEEQFYLVWPLLLLLCAATGHARARAQRIGWCLAGICLASFAVCVWTSLSAPPASRAAFYLMHMRAWELGVGGVVALLRPHALPSRATRHLAATGLACIAIAFLCIDARTPFPGFAALLPVAGAAAVLVGGALTPSTGASKALAWRPLVFVGKLSYSWYLWHWPLLAIGRSLSLGEASMPRDIALAAVSLLLAYASYRFIENPIRRRAPWPIHTARGALAAGLAGTVVLVAATQVMLVAARSALAREGTVENRLDLAARDRNPLRSICHGNPPFVTLPDRQSCTSGASPDGALQLLLWGDSHADHLMPGLLLASRSAGAGMVQRSFSACPPALGVVPVRGGQPLVDCERFNAAVLAELSGTDPARVPGVVVNARWAVYVGLATAPADNIFALAAVDGRRDHDGSLAALRAGLEATLGALQARKRRVLLVAPFPEMRYRAPDCLARRGIVFCSVARAEIERRRQPILVVLRDAVSRFDNARLWDPIAALCDLDLCRPSDDVVVRYLDDDHLTAAGAARLAPFAAELIQWLAHGNRPI